MLFVYLFLLEAATIGGLLSGGGAFLSAWILSQKAGMLLMQADATVVRATTAVTAAASALAQGMIEASANLSDGMHAVAHSLQSISIQAAAGVNVLHMLNGTFRQLLLTITHSVYVLSASIVVAFSGVLQQVQWGQNAQQLWALLWVNINAVLWCLLAGFTLGVMFIKLQLLQLQCDTERLERITQQGRTLMTTDPALQPAPLEPLYADEATLAVTPPGQWLQWPRLTLPLPAFDHANFHIQYRVFMTHALSGSSAFVGTLQTRLKLELLDPKGTPLPAVYSSWDVSNSRSHACQGSFWTDTIRTTPAVGVLPGSARASVEYRLILPDTAVRNDNPSHIATLHTDVQSDLYVRILGVKEAM